MSWRFISAAVLLGLVGSVATSAQPAPTTSRPAPAGGEFFEVASIRSVEPKDVSGASQTFGPCGGLIEETAGRLTITATTVYRLIAAAHGMSCGAANSLELISGGPDWLKRDEFNIQATLPPGTPLYTIRQLQNGEAPRIEAMLRNLLEDRFQLISHVKPKDTPIFNVYFVKEGRVKLSADQTKPSEAPNPIASPLQLRNDPVAGVVRVRGDAIPIRALTMAGQVREGRFVIDKTGLSGLYDVQPSIVDVGPAVFQAGFSAWPQMMDCLGFKLESTHGPVDSVVVDRLEKPSAN